MASLDGARPVTVASDELFENECGPCKYDGENKEGTNYCNNCEEFLCSTCTNSHRRFKNSRNHVILPAKDASKSVIKSEKGCIVLCTCDQNLETSVFCEDHEEIICTTCKTVKHRKCKTCSISDKSASFDIAKFDTVEEKMRNLRMKIQTFQKNRNADMQKLDILNEDCRQKIKSFRKEFDSFFDNLEQNMISELEQCTTEKRHVTQRHISTCSTTDHLLESDSKLMAAAKSSGIENQMFGTTVRLSNRIKECSAILQDLQEEAEAPVLQFKENSKLNKMKEEIKDLGTMIGKSLQAAATDHDKGFLNVKISAHRQVSIQMPDEEKTPWISGCDFMPNGELVICDNDNKRSMDDSLDDGYTEDYESQATSDDKKKLPKLGGKHKAHLRATQSETDGPVTRRGGPQGGTKLPKTIPHKSKEDDLVFESFYHRSGREFPCIYQSGMRFYLDDWGSKEWQPFPKRWYNEGLLVTNTILKDDDADNQVKKTYTRPQHTQQTQQAQPQQYVKKGAPAAKAPTQSQPQQFKAKEPIKKTSTEKDDGSKQPQQTTKSKVDSSDNQAAKGAAKSKESVKNNGTVKPASNFNAEDDCDKLYRAVSSDDGADEGVVVAIIPKRSNKQRQEIKKAYEHKYKKNLMIDLEFELQGDMEEIVFALLMTPTEYDAYVVHKAVEDMGISEATLIGILCTRSSKELKAIKDYYKRVYKTDMDQDISGDCRGEFGDLVMALCKTERDPGAGVNKEQAQNDAKALYKDGLLDLKGEMFRTLLTQRNHSQVYATYVEYEKLAGQDIYSAITKVMLDDDEGYLGVAKAVGDPVLFYTEAINSCFTSTGINDNQLIRVIVPRSEIDLLDIKAKHVELYSKGLWDVVNREVKGSYKNLLLAIINN